MFIIFPCNCAVYMYKIMILQKPLSQFHQILHWSYCWNVVESLFKWSRFIDCHDDIFVFKTKNCLNDELFNSCVDRFGKVVLNICISAMAMSLRWASRAPWAFCLIKKSWCFSVQKRMLLVLVRSVSQDHSLLKTKDNANIWYAWSSK